MCYSNVFKVCFCSSLGYHAALFVCVVFRLLMFTLGLFLSFRWDRRQTLVTIVASQVMKNQGLIKKMQMFHPHPGRKARSPLRSPAKKTKVATTVATKVATKVGPQKLLKSCSTWTTRQQKLTAQQLSRQQKQLTTQKLSPQRVPKAKEVAREMLELVKKNSAGRGKLT